MRHYLPILAPKNDCLVLPRIFNHTEHHRKRNTILHMGHLLPLVMKSKMIEPESEEEGAGNQVHLLFTSGRSYVFQGYRSNQQITFKAKRRAEHADVIFWPVLGNRFAWRQLLLLFSFVFPFGKFFSTLATLGVELKAGRSSMIFTSPSGLEQETSRKHVRRKPRALLLRVGLPPFGMLNNAPSAQEWILGLDDDAALIDHEHVRG